MKTKLLKVILCLGFIPLGIFIGSYFGAGGMGEGAGIGGFVCVWCSIVWAGLARRGRLDES